MRGGECKTENYWTNRYVIFIGLFGYFEWFIYKVFLNDAQLIIMNFDLEWRKLWQSSETVIKKRMEVEKESRPYFPLGLPEILYNFKFGLVPTFWG